MDACKLHNRMVIEMREKGQRPYTEEDHTACPTHPPMLMVWSPHGPSLYIHNKILFLLRYYL